MRATSHPTASLSSTTTAAGRSISAPGAENAEVDSGWIETADEANTFYAESSLYSDVSYRMYVFETDVMMWGGEDDYYERME